MCQEPSYDSWWNICDARAMLTYRRDYERPHPARLGSSGLGNWSLHQFWSNNGPPTRPPLSRCHSTAKCTGSFESRICTNRQNSCLSIVQNLRFSEWLVMIVIVSVLIRVNGEWNSSPWMDRHRLPRLTNPWLGEAWRSAWFSSLARQPTGSR